MHRWPPCFLAISFVLASPAAAQIDRMNYRHWVWLEEQRRELLADCLTLDAKRRTAVAASLLHNEEKVPPLTMARARALARGVEADGAFRFRAGLQLFALPEVIARGKKEVSVTVWAAFTGLTGKLPEPKSTEFWIRVVDAKGKVVRSAAIQKQTSMRDLREFRAVVRIEAATLPAGSYRVEVDTILDGEPPRPTDLPLTTRFAVQSDFADRADALRIDRPDLPLVAVLQKLGPLPRTVLQGAAERGTRAWYGVPGVDPSTAMVDLQRAETIRANIQADRFPLHGVRSEVTIALPVVGEKPTENDAVFVRLRLPEAGLPKPGSEAWKSLAAKPLVLFMPGIPSLDHQDRRPSYPHYTMPDFLMAQLNVAGFDSRRRFQVAVVESPGRMKRTRRGLLALLRELPRVFPFDASRLVLVGDGHGASGMADLALAKPGIVRGLVVANAHGGLAAPQLRRLPDTQVLGLAGVSPRAQRSIGLLQTYARYAEKAVQIQADPGRPWSLVLPMAAAEIDLFAQAVTKKQRGR